MEAGKLRMRTSGKLQVWFKIARLQFYPMTWLSYSLGAAAYSIPSGNFRAAHYLIGYAILFIIEFCAILANEYFDYDSDSKNKNYSIFTGGSRVLVEHRLNFRDVRTGIGAGFALIAVLSIALAMLSASDSRPAILSLIAAGVVLGLGYTVPPLKFSYRGLGEIVVGLTHSIYVILCGYAFQGGLWKDTYPWMLGVPLFFAVLGTNILAGIPDFEADGDVSKRSIAVIFGPRAAFYLAMMCLAAACLSGSVLAYFQLFPVSILYWRIFVIPHLFLLIAIILFRLFRSNNYEGRINAIMGCALAYIIWFGLLPLVAIW